MALALIHIISKILYKLYQIVVFSTRAMLCAALMFNIARAGKPADKLAVTAKWQAQAELESATGAPYSIIRAKGMLPLYQTNTSLLAVDVRGEHYTSGDALGNGFNAINFGAMYRELFGDVAFTLFGFIDEIVPSNFGVPLQNYRQGMVGTQMMSKYIDAQVNFYLPQRINEEYAISESTKRIDGKTITYKEYVTEQSAFGIEGELGVRFVPNDDYSVNLYFGAYKFSLPDNAPFYGPKIRTELQVNRLPMGMRVWTGLEMQAMIKEATSSMASCALVPTSAAMPSIHP
jgi:hypothetical protein